MLTCIRVLSTPVAQKQSVNFHSRGWVSTRGRVMTPRPRAKTGLAQLVGLKRIIIACTFARTNVPLPPQECFRFENERDDHFRRSGEGIIALYGPR